MAFSQIPIIVSGEYCSTVKLHNVNHVTCNDIDAVSCAALSERSAKGELCFSH